MHEDNKQLITDSDTFLSREDLIKKGLNEYFHISNDEEKDKLFCNVRDGIKAQKIVIDFYDWLHASMHPSPPNDAEANLRTNEDVFNQVQ